MAEMIWCGVWMLVMYWLGRRHERQFQAEQQAQQQPG